jgi:hypothetical protein
VLFSSVSAASPARPPPHSSLTLHTHTQTHPRTSSPTHSVTLTHTNTITHAITHSLSDTHSDTITHTHITHKQSHPKAHSLPDLIHSLTQAPTHSLTLLTQIMAGVGKCAPS